MSNENSSLLRVVGGDPLAASSATIRFDEYVPLQWRSYDESEALVVGYVRLGNFRTTLFEIAVAPLGQVIRSLTITSIASVSLWPEFTVTKSMDALPRLSTTFEGWKVVDVEKDFRVSTRPGEILIYWDELGACTAYSFAQTRFLVRDEFLAGVWFVGIEREHALLFLSHAQHENT